MYILPQRSYIKFIYKRNNILKLFKIKLPTNNVKFISCDI